MSQSVQALKESYSLFSKGDVATLVSQRFAENVELVVHAEDKLAFNGTYVGREQIQQYFETVATEFQFTEWDYNKFKYFDCGKEDGLHVVHALGEGKVLLLKHDNKPATSFTSHTFYLNDQWQIVKGIEVVNANVVE